VDLYAHAGHEHYTTDGMDHDAVWPVLRAEFANAVRTGSAVTADVARALEVQRLVEAARLSYAEHRQVALAEFDGNTQTGPRPRA
jgi:predicted dehydrogenase